MLSSHAIEVNPKHYEHFGREELISILKHELCHYHLHREGKGYKHSDREFKSLLRKVGGARHCQTLPDANLNATVEWIPRSTSVVTVEAA